MSAWQVENLGPESRKAHERRQREGFFDKYFGGVVLDVGYRGYEEIDVVPVLPDAIGIDLNYPGYDGKRLPFADLSVDTVYTSHTLEHIPDPIQAIQEWCRVLRYGGFLVITVPHQFLYEKRSALPSRWNLDHKRFYTPATLMVEIETALPPNSYRLRHLVDDDEHYSYSIPPEHHAGGAYQIELVIEKIQAPVWSLDPNSNVSKPSDLITSSSDLVAAREAEMQQQLLGAFSAIKDILLQADAEQLALVRHVSSLQENLTAGLIEASAIGLDDTSRHAIISSLLSTLPDEFGSLSYTLSASRDLLALLQSGIDGFIAEQKN